MKTKLIGMLVCMLLIATAFPAVGTINEKNNISPSFEQHEIQQTAKFSSHEPVVEWEYLYGGANDDIFRNIKQTTDGGYIAVGVWDGIWSPTQSGSHWLVKLDANGMEEWNVTALYNATHWPRCYMVEETHDGGFVTAGCHESGTWGYNRCIWKVDANGNTEWLEIYDDPGYHLCIQQTTDYGYIIAGEMDIGPQDWDVLLMKTDSTGTVEWQKIWRFGDYGDNAYAVRQTPSDGGYILAGRIGITSSEADFLVIKTDASGNMLWNKTYGGDDWEWTQSQDILLASDGGYYFLGETDSYGQGSRDIWLFKTDANGNMEWNKTYGTTKYDACGGMDFTDDGGIIITGTIDFVGMSSPKSEGIVIKIDEHGIIEWQQTFGYENIDQLQSVYSTNDGGYIVAGNCETPGSGAVFFDAWVIKIEEFDNTHPDKPDKPSGTKRVKANTAYTYTSSTSDSDGDELYYQWDWGDGNFSDWLGPYNTGDTVEAEYTWLQSGQYNVKVCARDEHGAISDWSESLPKNMPNNKIYNFNYPVLSWILKQFPHMFPILRTILGF